MVFRFGSTAPDRGAGRPRGKQPPSPEAVHPLTVLGSNHARFLRDSKQKYFAIGCGPVSHAWGILAMKRRQFLRAAAASSTIAIAGCGGGGDEGPSGSTEQPEDAEVGAEVTFTEEQVFDPVKVEVETGQSVEWINQTGSTRILEANTEPDGATEWNLNIEVPADGSAFFPFEEGGIYSYHDQEETWFNSCGAVAVGDNSTDDIGTLRCE